MTSIILDILLKEKISNDDKREFERALGKLSDEDAEKLRRNAKKMLTLRDKISRKYKAASLKRGGRRTYTRKRRV